MDFLENDSVGLDENLAVVSGCDVEVALKVIICSVTLLSVGIALTLTLVISSDWLFL